MLTLKWFGSSIAVCFLLLKGFAFAAELSIEHAPLSPDLVAVPQYLLGLIHSAEVQAELSFSPEQLSSWEKTLQEIDARWWPARILPAVQQRKIVAELEVKMINELETLLGADAVRRLHQIELQSQSSRILSRPEVAKFLGLDAKQNKKLADLFGENDKLAAELSSKNGKADPEKKEAYTTTKRSETKTAVAMLTPSQSGRLRGVFGKPFETAKLERIYPLAPKLIESGQWTNSEHPTLELLRGKVVVVHFYAFQCHNCVANFGHYKRWDETLKGKSVQLIGIQTPETSAEREPEKVRSAANKEGFQFPVLIDIESKNWAAWGNTMWPTVYVIDKEGYIRFWWQGELNWQGATTDKTIEAVIDQLLSES